MAYLTGAFTNSDGGVYMVHHGYENSRSVHLYAWTYNPCQKSAYAIKALLLFFGLRTASFISVNSISDFHPDNERL
jgi:hypothetical protein